MISYQSLLLSTTVLNDYIQLFDLNSCLLSNNIMSFLLYKTFEYKIHDSYV